MSGRDEVRVIGTPLSAALRALCLGLSMACCMREDVELAHDGPDAGRQQVFDGSGEGGSPAADDAADGGTGSQVREAYCSGHGPPADLNWPRPGVVEQAAGCRRGLASRVFRYGLCSCSIVGFGGDFTLDAFDSQRGPYQQGQDGASLGLNVQLTSAGVFDIRGSLISSGSGALLIASGSNHVAANFKANAELVVNGAIDVDRDLWVNGEITAGATTNVHGNVYQTPGHAQPSGLTLSGQMRTQDFSVAEPCACGAPDLLDVAAVVASATPRTDNADFGISAAELDVLPGNTFDVPCGRLAFAGVNIGLGAKLTAHGRSALFIDGNLAIFGGFGTEPGNGELDVFVSGSLVLGPAATIGSKERPAALRFYVAGFSAIGITPLSQFAANLYAPHVSIAVSSSNDVYGAFFVWSYTTAAPSQLHYDSAILQLGDPDDGSCSEASPDGGCTSDQDCSAPLICSQSQCTFSDARTTPPRSRA